MAPLNFGATRLGAGDDDSDGLAALRRALLSAGAASSSAGGREEEGEGNGGGGGGGGNSPSLFDRAFAAHALTPALARALAVPEAERPRWAPRAALGDMLRYALSEAEEDEAEEGGGDDGSGANGGPAPVLRPLRAAELALWFSCVDADGRGGAIVSLDEYRRGVEALRARVAAGGGGGRGPLPPPVAAPQGAAKRRPKTDVTRGAGEGTSMAAAFGELVARHARS